MKSNTLFTLISLLTLVATGCGSQQSKDEAAIRNAVAEMNDIPVPRKPEENSSHTIHTSKGVLAIATCEGRKDEDGRIWFEGPSRSKGFFLTPRMEWARNAEEATRLLLDDYEAGNLSPSFPVEETLPPSP